MHDATRPLLAGVARDVPSGDDSEGWGSPSQAVGVFGYASKVWHKCSIVPMLPHLPRSRAFCR